MLGRWQSRVDMKKRDKWLVNWLGVWYDLVMNAAVKQVNLQDAKTNLSRYVDDVQNGEVIVLCRHNKPIAEIRGLENAEVGTPKFGIFDGFGVSPEFFEALPDEFLRAFEGQ